MSPGNSRIDLSTGSLGPATPIPRKRKAPEVAHDNEERWLLTYADMITLLLVLFVVLFAMSQINVPKFLAFRDGLTQTFNPSAVTTSGGDGLLDQTSLESETNNNSSLSPQPTKANQTTDNLEHIASAIEKALASKNLQGSASVSVTGQQVVVQILADLVYYQTDVASLGTRGDEVVDLIARTVRHFPNDIEVQGYTDNEPVTGGPYSSNWELSADRAANVVNRMNTVDGLPATRLSSIGFGETHPLASNATAQGRRMNRRIDVVILGNGG